MHKNILLLITLMLVSTMTVFAQETEQKEDQNATEETAKEQPRDDKDKPKDDKEKPVSKPAPKPQKIYVKTDAYGNRTYSDMPQKGAKELDIQKSTEYTPPKPTNVWTDLKPKVVEQQPSYSHFSIVSPTNDSTVRNNAGNVQLALDIRPKLLPGHKLVLFMDGNEMPTTGSSILSLSNVDRGSHTFEARIQSAEGEIIVTTETITVHLHRAVIRRGN